MVTLRKTSNADGQMYRQMDGFILPRMKADNKNEATGTAENEREEERGRERKRRGVLSQ